MKFANEARGFFFSEENSFSEDLNLFSWFTAERNQTSLPSEATRLILSQLDLGDVGRIAQVSREWNKVSTSNSFWRIWTLEHFPGLFESRSCLLKNVHEEIDLVLRRPRGLRIDWRLMEYVFLAYDEVPLLAIRHSTSSFE